MSAHPRNLRDRKIRSGMMNVDGHAGARQVDFHFRDLPGRLNAKNLAVKLAVVHKTGLESGPAASLAEPRSPHKTGKSHFFFGNTLRLRHCYVVSSDGTTYSLFPKKSNGNTVGQPERDDRRDINSGGICKPCPARCGQDQDQCFRDEHNRYPVGQYRSLGPNSNTYAGILARACCDGGLPGGLGSAPGINDSPPPPSGGGH